jgi:hypothetical protein
MLVTMLALPMVALGYAIIFHLSPPEMLKLLNGIGLFNAPANLLLVLVAGLVPRQVAASTQGSAPAMMSQASAVASGSSSPAAALSNLAEVFGESPSPPVAEKASYDHAILLCVGGAGLIILLIVGAVIVHGAPAAPVNTVTPSPTAGHIERNGLDKNTNDFLRQLSQQQPARR